MTGTTISLESEEFLVYRWSYFSFNHNCNAFDDDFHLVLPEQ